MYRNVKIIMILLSLFFLFIGTLGGRPPECKWSVETNGVTPSATEGLRALCLIRTLTPSLFNFEEGNSSLAALSHATHITALTLKCARQVVFKSELQPSIFSIFARLEDLTLLNCKLTLLPNHSLSGLPHLRKLTIKSHHEDWPGASLKIEQYALSDLPKLEELDLSYNHIWALPDDNLCHLPSLTSLNLTYNGLHDLNDLRLGAGGCSHPILHLYLDYNEINEIHQQGLDGARNLRFLSISNNHISHIADSSFEGLFELRHLDLSVNNLVAVPQTALQDLQQLRDLNLSNNSLNGFPPKLFQSLGHLLILNLNNNKLDLSSNNIEPFSGLIRLVILDLSHNELSYIGKNTFQDLYSLQVLYLNFNSISYLEDDTFSALANLHTLDLSNNKISIITSTGFRGLSVLTFLRLDNNQISEIQEKSFDNCTSLQIITISSNKILKIPKAINKIELLKSVDFSYNKIEFIKPKSLNRLKQLQKLYLHHNLISNISKESFTGLMKLKLLDLSFNKIREIHNGTFNMSPQLYGLNISNNYLKSLYGVAMFHQNLTWLNVSHNNLDWFDYVVVPSSLRWIDISYNQLDKIGNHYKFGNNLNLNILYASNNNFTEINGHSIVSGIEKLYLQNNLIDYVASNTFKDKKNINLIDLSNNRLSILGDSSIRLSQGGNFISSNPILLLTGNMLECNCGAEWLLKAAKGGEHGQGSLLPRLGDVTNVKCKLPGIWDNALVPVVTVEPQQFLCTYRRHCFPVCHCCEFDACDCEQTCPTNCSCYHDHTWTHNIVDCGESDWTKMPSGVPMDVTEAYMDGNNIGALTSHALIGRKNLKMLYLNNSHITNIQNRTFNGLKNLLVLKLSNNKLEKLYGYEFLHLHNLLELHLDFNKLMYLGNITFSPLRSLEVLKLDHNHLTSFPVWNLALNPFLIEVSLNDNPWSCECSYLTNLKAWLEANRIKTSNGSIITCFHNITGEKGPSILSDTPIKCDHYVASNNISNLIMHDYIMLIAISIAIIMLIFCGVLIVFAYKRRIKLWAFTNYGKRLFDKSSSYIEDREKLFDIFVSHSAKDSSWVCGLLAPELETKGYRLCVAHRDCTIPSAPLTSQAITESISCSRRVIMVISKGFTDVEWCRYEFKSAHMESLENIKKKHLIIIFLEDVPQSEIDTELNLILKSASMSLTPRDAKFWRKLRKSLPKLKLNKRYQNTGGIGKTVSHPLVPMTNQTGSAWPITETKTISSVSNHSLTVNPYWETAITSIPERNWRTTENSRICKPTWLAPINCTSNSQTKETKDSDHTYMTMIECEDSPSLNTTLNSIDTIPVSANDENISCQVNFQNRLPNKPYGLTLKDGRSRTLQNNSNNLTTSLLRQERPDYLTRSWIFHPPPNHNTTVPSQTYFV